MVSLFRLSFFQYRLRNLYRHPIAGQPYTHSAFGLNTARRQRRHHLATPLLSCPPPPQPQKPSRMSWSDDAREISAGGNTLEAAEVSRLDLSFCIARGQVFPEPRRAGEEDRARKGRGGGGQKEAKKEERMQEKVEGGPVAMKFAILRLANCTARSMVFAE